MVGRPAHRACRNEVCRETKYFLQCAGSGEDLWLKAITELLEEMHSLF